jgi:hypothetical protein
MKKFILSIFLVALGFTYVSAQEMTLRLQMPDTPPNVGEEFLVGVWFDVLEYPGYPIQTEPTLKSGQMGVTYDPAVLTPVKTGGPPALQKYAWNLNAMFTDYAAVPAEALPTPGDLRFVSFTTLAPGMDPSFYGDEPFHMWDLKFLYNGGDIEISWQDADKTTPVAPNITGGTKEKIVTFWTAWDNEEYAMTYMNIPAEAATNMWTGALDNDWFNAGNWSEGVVPTTEDVEIDVTTKGNPVIFGGSATTGALTIMTGAGLSVDVTGNLTTNGLFTCDGAFEIMTDMSGYSGSFIDMGGLAGTGTFTMDRYVTCSMDGDPNNPAEPVGWHYVSAPIDGVSTDDMLDYYVNQWDETTSMWMNYAGTQPCIPYAPAETLNGMDVWSVKYDQNWSSYGCPQTVNGDVIMYSGAFTDLHTGPYSSPATYTAGAYAGWNMAANPYPSGLDLNAIVWDANAIPGVALYDACPGNYGYWTPALGSYSIPVGNGFFTEYTAAGTFSLTGAERAHDPDFYYKEEITSLLTLEAVGQGASDLLYVRFMEEAQPGFAADGDFHKLFSTAEELPQIYTTAGADQLAINALPATEMVPMGFTSVTSGEYTISAIETSEFAEVYLQDLVTGEVTNLLSSPHTFEYVTGEDANRFIIHFAPVGINQISNATVNIWSLENNIMVNVPSNVTGEIAVYNMMGQQVVRTDIAGTETQIKVSDVNTNYVVKVISESNTVTGKVYVK